MCTVCTPTVARRHQEGRGDGKGRGRTEMVWVHTCMCTGSKGEMAGGCAPIPTPEGGDSEMVR